MPRTSRPALLLTGLAVALTGTLAPAPASAVAGGSISGQMLVSGGGAVAGAEVTLYAGDWGDWYADQVVETGADGSYQLTGIAPGTYRLGFRDPTGDHATEYWSNWATLEDADDLYVAAGAALTGKTVVVTPAGHVTGSVSGDGGAPLADVAVTAYRHTYPWTATSWEALGETVTAADGTYDLGGLSGGTYRIGFDDTTQTYLPEFWDDAATVAAGTDVVVREDQDTAIGDARLARGASIAGTVTGSGGVLADARVTAYAYDEAGGWWEPVSSTWTDESGDYRLGGLVADTYRVGFRSRDTGHLEEFWDDAATVEDATSIPVAAGADVPDTDADLALGGRITGQVTAPGGAPIADAWVAVFQDRGDWGWEPVSDAYTDETGAFDASGLPTGEYVVWFESWTGDYLDEYWDDAHSFETATRISVTAGATVADTDAELAPSASISGTVTAPLPLWDVQVSAYEQVDGEWQRVSSTWVQEDGRYDLRGIDGGTYRLRFRDWSDQLRTEFWDDQPSVELAHDITVAAAGSVTGRDAALAPVATPSPTPTPTTVPTPTTAPTPTPTPGPSVAAQLSSIASDLAVKGRPVVGRTVRVKNLVAQLRTKVSYRFRWYAGKAKVRKATKASLKVTPAMRGKALKVKVTLRADGASKVVTLKLGTVR
ncbi:carboxypeptidase regulatory-like domain-containing protein [Nocardioides sp. J2M5]|uniref:MSCRAMM family protein n=1 Tax=Nocardioides palaemonis TaxID=2829810 RepID=UPI001BA8DF1B|nr:carboxypeptidase-like regulatory domain-containing protein [Nocardioides palaemonis]MBS2936167.1 carboxypeptidase regulatory-like domain-containing protein [Nocardioides palaemonis]